MSKTIQSILLVDDDSDDQLLFQEALEDAGSHVLCVVADNGIDALQKLNSLQHLPDIIIMDVNMPVMNGMECLKELKKSGQFSSIPVIMYSTSCSADCQKECFDNGAVAYMEKPSDYLLLCAHIKSILATGLPASFKTPVIV